MENNWKAGDKLYFTAGLYAGAIGTVSRLSVCGSILVVMFAHEENQPYVFGNINILAIDPSLIKICGKSNDIR